MVVYMFNMFIVQRLNKYLQIQDFLEYISRDYLHSQHFENIEPELDGLLSKYLTDQ